MFCETNQHGRQHNRDNVPICADGAVQFRRFWMQAATDFLDVHVGAGDDRLFGPGLHG